MQNFWIGDITLGFPKEGISVLKSSAKFMIAGFPLSFLAILPLPLH
jgi:hypothetical protein